MVLFAGTPDGVYRVDTTGSGGTERVLEIDGVCRVRRFDDTLYAATRNGLFRTTDGEEWTDLWVPLGQVTAVVEGPEHDRLYAGTCPAHVYVSMDGGVNWRDLEAFRDTAEEWTAAEGWEDPHVRALSAHPRSPTRIVAAVGTGGVHVSEDRGETWFDRSGDFTGVDPDVLDLTACGRDTHFVATGDGLYETRTAGRSWTRIGGVTDAKRYTAVVYHEDLLCVAAVSDPPAESGESDGLLLESDDEGASFRERPFPGGPDDPITALAVDDSIRAGTQGGRLLIRDDEDGATGEWSEVGRLPAPVASLVEF